MYAIAHYWTPDGSRVPTAGGMTMLVIADLKTTRGVHTRALRLAGRAGRGNLFGFEVWSHRGDKYQPAEAVYTSERLDRATPYRVRQWLPMVNVANKANAEEDARAHAAA